MDNNAFTRPARLVWRTARSDLKTCRFKVRQPAHLVGASPYSIGYIFSYPVIVR